MAGCTFTNDGVVGVLHIPDAEPSLSRSILSVLHDQAGGPTGSAQSSRSPSPLLFDSQYQRQTVGGCCRHQAKGCR